MDERADMAEQVIDSVETGETTPGPWKLSQNRWHGRLARADLSQCERSAMMKRTGETPVPPEVGF